MPQIGDLFVKLGRGETLMPGELETLRLEMNRLQSGVSRLDAIMDSTGRVRIVGTPYETFAQPGEPAIKRKTVGNQALANGVETTLSFTTAAGDTFDAGDIIQPDADFKVWTVQFKGVYLVTARAQFDSNATGYRGLYITDDQAGTSVLRARHAPATANAPTALGVTGIMHWPKGATFWVIAQQNSGVELNVDVSHLDVIFLCRFK